MFFMGAAGDALADQFGTLSNHNFEFWFEVMPYLLGSLFYWISSLICLWLWKNQHYGLVMLGNRTQWHRLSKPKSGSLGWGQFAILNIILMTATGRSAAPFCVLSLCPFPLQCAFSLARSIWSRLLCIFLFSTYCCSCHNERINPLCEMEHAKRRVGWLSAAASVYDFTD